jgi:hypothetical protein
MMYYPAPANQSGAMASSAKKINVGDKFLGLQNGSLVESVYFYNVWKKLHPDEAALVLITSPTTGPDVKNQPVTAVTVYSTNGFVRAHTVDYGKVALGTLQPNDLRRNPARCLAEYLKTVAKLPRRPVPAIGSPEEQIEHAFTAFQNHRKTRFCPVTIADSPDSTGKSLVFDWNDTHYAWRPSTGAVRADDAR